MRKNISALVISMVFFMFSGCFAEVLIDPEANRAPFQGVSIELFNVFYKFRNDFSEERPDIELVVIHMPRATARDVRVLEEWSQKFLALDLLYAEHFDCTHFYLDRKTAAGSSVKICQSHMRGITLEISNYQYSDTYVNEMLRRFQLPFANPDARRQCAERLRVSACS